ncbi:MAG: RNA-binding protein [Gammaproteobacteria bacterium]|jgi:RNA recognition motif-containing protein|nr:RNA-binding protein [Gammaproteobacteria bacterium]
MKKLFVGNLPKDASEDSVRELFSEYGTVRSIKINSDIFTGKCRGFGFIEMEGHEARAAVAELDGKSFGGNFLKIRFEDKTRSRSKRSR